jgi:hypothetical protein
MKAPQSPKGPTAGDGQLGLGLRIPSRPLRLSRDLRDVPLERYRLEGDGRKWKSKARDRMSAAGWLATYGDADGSRIFPSVLSLARHFGWSRRKAFYVLSDLKELGLLEGGGLTSEHGTRIRRMNLAAFLGAGVQDSRGAGVQDSRGAGVQDSRAGVQSNVAPNRHLTDQRQNQNLRPLTRPSSPPLCGKLETKRPPTPQQRRFAIVRRLAEAAAEILGRCPDCSWADLAEDLKQCAAKEGIEYFDAWPGAASPIQQAIEIAMKRRKTA